MAARSTSPARHLRRIGRGVAVAALVAAVATGCSSDGDDGSAEERFCAAGESLQTDIAGLASLDLISGGLDALTEQFDAVQQDVADLRDAGADVADAELNELNDSVATLDDAISALGDDISAANASGVATAIGDVASAAGAVIDVLTSTCS